MNERLTAKSGPRRSPFMVGVNADFEWAEFDSAWYFEHNYMTLRDDDAQILRGMRDFFSDAVGDFQGKRVDVGTGTNLYPALAMLPFCEEINLLDLALPNIRWLEQEVGRISPSWQEFWKVLSTDMRYSTIGNPQPHIATKVKIAQHSVFDLPAETWDIGTMFFVAESISTARIEFELAIKRFLGALRPGSAFGAAFMAGSVGYDVGTSHFPAVSVDAADVHSCLSAVAHRLRVTSIESNTPLRDGYDGMLLATGIAGKG